MPYVLLALLVLLSLAIAYAIIGREARRQRMAGPLSVFDVDEAVKWIGDRLPEEIQGRISYDELRQLLTWTLEFMRSHGAISNGHTPAVSGPVHIQGADSAAYVLKKAKDAGLEVDVTDVYAILDGQVAYLQNIGAIGERATDVSFTEKPEPGP